MSTASMIDPAVRNTLGASNFTIPTVCVRACRVPYMYESLSPPPDRSHLIRGPMRRLYASFLTDFLL